MRFVLWMTGLFALAVLIGLASALNTGYAILFLPPYRIELSFNLLLVTLVVLVAITHLLLKLIGMAAGLPEEVRRHRRRQKLRTARHALRDASLALFEGRFKRAEREAAKAIDDEYAPENRALALLVAARAAAATRDADKCRDYLAQLDGLPDELQLARHLQEAELAFDAKDAAGALAALERVRAKAPKLTAALRLELKVRLQQKQHSEVLSLTEQLLKADAIDADQARRYRQLAWRSQLQRQEDGAALRGWLKKVPDVERNAPELLAAIVRRYAELGLADAGVELLAERLDDGDTAPELTRELARLAPQLGSEARRKVFRNAEKWLKADPADAQLLLALGRLALSEQLWGKAESYLQASLSLTPSLAAHSALAQLFESIEQPDAAAKQRAACLALALEADV